MPDREKVINGLRSIKTYLASQAIETKDDLAREGFIKIQKDIDDALALLKEQEAVEPHHKCQGDSYSLITEKHWKYCPWCGRSVKWG